MLGEAGKVKKRIMKKKYSEEVPSGWCAFPLFQDLTGDDHDNGSDGEENRTRVSTGSYALRVFKHPIALGNLQHGQYEASFPCTISSSGAGGDDAESKYDRKESTTLGLALEPLGETLSMTLFDKYNIPDKVNIPLMKTEKIKQNISWLQSLTHRPSKQSVKRFDGFDIYVDQCRFLPMNTALSRVTLRLYTAHNAKQSQFLMVSKGEWEFNDLHSHIERPEYRFRCEFRGDKYLLYPSLIAVFTVSCLDRFDGTMKVIGETGLNIYNQKGTLTPHPPATLVEVKKRQALFEASRRKRNANVGGSDSGGVNAGGGREENANSKKESNIGGHHLSDTDLDSLIDSTISLNTGCFQLPLYAQRNYSKELTVASYKRLKRLPCATMLVRIVRPAKDRDGRALSTTTVPPAEWANAGLISEPPQYWTGAYDSSKCIPTGPEQKLYNTLNKCKPTRVIDVIPEFLDENMMYHRFVKATTEADDAKNGGKGGGKGRGSRNRPLVKLDMTNDMALDDWMRNMLLLANHKVPYTISSQQKIHGQLRHDKLVLYPLLSPHYPYVSSRGFRVSVDGVHLIDDSDVVVTVLTSLNPPASYYQQVPLTAGVHMTDKYNWNSYQKSPQFRSGFQHFKDVPFNENTVLIIDVRQVKRPDILVKNKFADPDAYVERTSTGMRRRHVHTGGNAADELRQKLESQPTSLGWTILPVFKKASDSQGGLRYVNTGNFQLPLFEGKPDRVLLNHMLQESPIAVMKKSQARRGSAQLRIKEWTSVFVRLVDEGRFELLPKHGPAHADKSFLDTRKLDKYKYDPKSLSRSGFFGWSKAPTLGERILKVDTDEVFPLLTKDRKTVNDEEDLDADVDGDSEGHGEKETMKGKGQFALFESRLVAAFKESLGL